MIHILLILLGILGILLIGIAVILFVPIQYRIKIRKREETEKLRFEFHAHWFLKLLSVDVSYIDEKFDWRVRLAWKKIEDKDGKDAAQDKELQETKNEHSKEKTNRETNKDTAETPKNENLFSKIKCTIINICDRIKEIWNTKKKITDFITEDRHLSTFGKVKNEVFGYLKKIIPYHLKGFVRFGCEDPYNTGRILAILSAIYPFYGDRIDIFPEFEHKVFQCDLHAKGRIRSFGLLLAVVKLFFDKDVRYTYKNYMSLKE